MEREEQLQLQGQGVETGVAPVVARVLVGASVLLLILVCCPESRCGNGSKDGGGGILVRGCSGF